VTEFSKPGDNTNPMVRAFFSAYHKKMFWRKLIWVEYHANFALISSSTALMATHTGGLTDPSLNHCPLHPWIKYQAR
jgi:hypothetical protein